MRREKINDYILSFRKLWLHVAYCMLLSHILIFCQIESSAANVPQRCAMVTFSHKVPRKIDYFPYFTLIILYDLTLSNRVSRQGSDLTNHKRVSIIFMERFNEGKQ